MLMKNNEYTMVLVANGETLSVSFLTEFSPAYTTPRRLRSRYGALVSDATDMQLWEAIFDASLEADYHTRDIYEDEVNHFARERWVACRATISWIRQAVLKDVWLSAKRRRLGDLSIDDKDTAPRDLMELLNRLKEDCEKWAKEFLGVKGKGLSLSEYAQWQSRIQVNSRSWG